MITSEEIKRRLWDGANELRGSMDASRYKDYMLGLMFYKFLSDKTLEQFKIALGKSQLSENELVDEYVKAKIEYGDELEKTIQRVLGYCVSPEYLYQTWIKDINSGIYIVDCALLFEALTTLKTDNAQGEYYLTDIFKYFRDKKIKIGAVPVENNLEITGINNVEQLEELENLID